VRAASKKERHSWYLFLASKIAHLNYIKSCETSNTRADTRLITLFNSETVTDLHLDHRPINAEGAVALSRTLPAHDETESLSLVNCSLTDATVKPIAEVLEKLSLKVLNLSKNNITSAGAEELARGLAANDTLVELILEDNQIDDAGVQALAQVIASKSTVTVFNLNGNRVGAGGAKAFSQLLSNPSRGPLSVLNLARNKLGDEGAAALVPFLKENNTVTKVHLSANGIGDRGAAAIADALHDASVIDIDLSHNLIGVQGALAIEKLLQKNSTVVNVDLSHSKKLMGSSALAPLLKEGFVFPQLSLSREV